MNLPGREMWLSANAPWLLTTPGLRGVMRATYSARLGGAAHARAALPESSSSGTAARSACGAMLLRFWLRLHELGLGMHPFGNLVTNAAAHEDG